MAESWFSDGSWWHRQPDGSLLRWDDQGGRWVPVGPESPVGEPARSDPWLRIGGRAQAIRVLLYVTAGLSAVAAISDGFEYELLTRIDAGEQVSDGEIDFNDARQGVIGLLQFGLYIATVVLFLMWFFRAYSNLPRLGASDLRYKPGWSIGAWFVPIFNLFGPKQMANDIWRASDPGLPAQSGTSWKDGPIPGWLFGLWWAFWLLSGAGSANVFDGDDVDELKMQTAFWFVSDSVTVFAALLAAVVVARTTRRQEERARLLGFTTAD